MGINSIRENSMKRCLCSLVAHVVISLTAAASPAPLFENTGTITIPPQVHALEFINYGTLDIFTDYPFDTQDTLRFVNHGVMEGSVGFRFDHSTALRRGPASSFDNRGSIFASDSGYSDFGLDIALLSGVAVGSYINISATNITSRGIMGVGPTGLLQISGGNIDLSRSVLLAGFSDVANLGTPYYSYIGEAEYLNPGGVSEIFWGVGVNGLLNPEDQNSFPLNLNTVIQPSSGAHQVATATGFTNFTVIPGFAFGGSYAGFAVTNTVSATNWVTQVVYVPTVFGAGGTSEVRFAAPTNLPAVQGMQMLLVELSLPAVDPVTLQSFTNRVYVKDFHGAVTNGILLTNLFSTNLMRPNVLEYSLAAPGQWANAGTTNVAYSDELIFSPLALGPSVTNRYASFSARIGRPSRLVANDGDFGFFPGFFGFFGEDAIFGGAGAGYLTDPTNEAARVEINAQSLDLFQTRLQSDGVMSIKARHFTGRSPALTDAPYFRFDLGSTNGFVTISNVIPASIRRPSGELTCWSGVWTNYVGIVGPSPEDPAVVATNTVEILTHVLIVDPFDLGIERFPETVEASFRSDRVEFFDIVRVTGPLLIDAESFRNVGEIGMFFPRTLGVDQLPRMMELENEGIINAPDGLRLGTDRTEPFDRVANSGTLVGSGVGIKTQELEHTGIIVGTDGLVRLEAHDLKIEGGSVAALLDLQVRANDFKLQNASLESGARSVDPSSGRIQFVPGTLQLWVTNRLTDGGMESDNFVTVHDGFRLMVKPMEGDLLGTTVRSLVNFFGEALHLWAGEDRGPTAEGYVNNVALGRLVLDGDPFGLFTFGGTGAANALYVNFLEFENAAVDVAAALNINPGFKIYFHDSNLPVEELDGLFDGALVHVAEIPVEEPPVDGQSFRVRMQRPEISVGGPDVLVWSNLPGTLYTVEYTHDVGSGEWSELAEVKAGPSRSVSFVIPRAQVPSQGSVFYRVVEKNPIR